MNLLPDPSIQSNRQPVPDMTVNSSLLCLACGLCCTGVLHPYARLTPDETGLALSLGLTVDSFKERPGFHLPCPLYQHPCCSIYTAPRPRVCGDYQCDLLKKFLAGAISPEESLYIIGRARELLAKVTAQLPPGDTFIRFRQDIERDREADSSPALLLTLGKLEWYLLKHFDSAPKSGPGA